MKPQIKEKEEEKESDCCILTQLICSSILNSFLGVMMRTVDVIMLGHLGVHELASGALGSALFNSCWVFLFGFFQ